jgi:NADPH:quinone reductase-like Zn-dependent oxidoreductase
MERACAMQLAFQQSGAAFHPIADEIVERLKALGASDVINYTETPDWDAKVSELTDGRGVDCIVEIGGPGTIAMSLKALAVGGHISLIGASLSASGTGLDPLLLTGRDRPDRGHGPVLGVLVVVEEDPTAFLLPPFRPRPPALASSSPTP